MRGEIHRESDTHDEVDHGDAVQVDSPQRHVSNHTNLYAHDAEGHPERADGVGDEDQRDDAHNDGGDDGRLDGDGPHVRVLEQRKRTGETTVSIGWNERERGGVNVWSSF